jgi:hypothetical protein
MTLQERLEKFTEGLRKLELRRERMAAQFEELEVAIHRQEGAVMAIQEQIAEGEAEPVVVE